MQIEQHIWGITPEGHPIIIYKMTNARGESVELTNYGGAIVSVSVLDNKGNIGDVALGYTRWQDYVSDGPAAGKSVGRYANRIAKGKFTLGGKEYRLAINNGPNHLHGGPTGFQNRIWESRVETNRVVMSYLSADGEEGYPGEVTAEVCYDFDDNANLEITYFARSSAPTIINLTNHIYFNLKGDGQGTIDDHILKLYANKWLPTDATQIPTGELADVVGTPMDFFTAPTALGARIDDDFEALKIGKGYDHCWAINGWSEGKLCLAAELHSPQSGRTIKISTTQPGIQVYTGNWLAGSPMGKNGQYVDRSAVALECQALPDSPNKPQFPSVVLDEGQTYKQHIIYSFSAK